MTPTARVPETLLLNVMAHERSPGDRSHRRVSTAALVLALLSVLSFRMTPAVGHLHLADLLAYVLPQLLAAAGAAVGLRAVARRSGLGDGPLQSTAVLLAGLGAFELVGIGLDASHAIGVHGLIDHGGWAALPIALGLGAAVGLLACAATVHVRRFVAARIPRRRRSTGRSARLAAAVLVPSGALIARNLAGRAPPVLSR
jgi:hypothetical protein